MTAEATVTAGRLLREARERQGLHIAALAASIKVPTKKLEALEADRLDELPDATFGRALAQTVCRALKIDPEPVMALLPRQGRHRLEQVSEGLNTPFRERPATLLPSDITGKLGNPALWITAVVLLAALVVWLWPAAVSRLVGSERAAAAASAVDDVVSASASAIGATPTSIAALPEPGPAATSDAPSPDVMASDAATPAGAASDAATALASTTAIAAAAATPGASAPAGVLLVRTRATSWVEVVDGRGQTLVSRLLQPGEAIGLDGEPPLRLRIGNAGATEVRFRGRATALEPHTRDNVARFELR